MPTPALAGLPLSTLLRTSVQATETSVTAPDAPIFAINPCCALIPGLLAVLLVTVTLSTAAFEALPASPAWVLIAGPLFHCLSVLPLMIAVIVPVGAWFSMRIAEDCDAP